MLVTEPLGTNKGVGKERALDHLNCIPKHTQTLFHKPSILQSKSKKVKKQIPTYLVKIELLYHFLLLDI